MTQLARIPVTQRLSPGLYVLRAGGLLVFSAIPLMGLLASPLAGQLVWNVVSFLPLVVVILGYHRWRQVCPLYLLTRLSRPRPGRSRRRVPKWMAGHAYYIAFGLFLLSIWLRLVVTNVDGPSLAVYFVVLAVVAATIDHVFTGRTWCNHFCPMSFVERIYSESVSGSGKMTNSQCATCTGCRQACPDIDLETSYRTEMPLLSKRFVYFAFPGLVVGFFAYSYLQSGTWHTLPAGHGSLQAGFPFVPFLPGHDATTAGLFFLPQMPRALAAMLTLAGCSLIALGALWLVERLFRLAASTARSPFAMLGLRHTLFGVTAFVSFVTFYLFVGRTLFWTAAWPFVVLEAGVFVIASVSLVRRLRRTPTSAGEGRRSRGGHAAEGNRGAACSGADAVETDTLVLGGLLILDEPHRIHRHYSTRAVFEADARQLTKQARAMLCDASLPACDVKASRRHLVGRG